MPHEEISVVRSFMWNCVIDLRQPAKQIDEVVAGMHQLAVAIFIRMILAREDFLWHRPHAIRVINIEERNRYLEFFDKIAQVLMHILVAAMTAALTLDDKVGSGIRPLLVKCR